MMLALAEEIAPTPAAGRDLAEQDLRAIAGRRDDKTVAG